MSRLARWIARLVWGHMLWTMRRPVIRSLRKRVSKRLGSWESVKRQDRFARRYGLRVLTALFTLVVVSMTLTAMVYAALWMVEAGVLRRPTLR